MADWHGYPQHPDAHPERPWWRRTRIDDTEPCPWRRLDDRDLHPVSEWVGDDAYDCGWQDSTGWVARRREAWAFRLDCIARTMDAALAAYDAAHPLPPPEPRCGQVWVWPASGAQRQIVEVEPNYRGGWLLTMGMRPFGYGGRNTAPWPPPGAVLVAGPGAPWAPMGEK